MIAKAKLIALLVAVGVTKAETMNDKQLERRADTLPDKLPESEVPEGHMDTYKALCDGEDIDFGKSADEDGEKPKGKKAGAKKKAAAKSDKPAKKKAAAKSDKPKKERATVETDEFGCRVGSLTSKVALCIKDGKPWEVADVAEKLGIPVSKARGRLYRLKKRGLAELNRSITFTLTAPKGKKSAK